MQNKSIFSFFALVLFIASASAVCDLRDRLCNSDSDCAYDTFGYNLCTRFGPFGFNTYKCGPGGTPYSGNLCPMLGAYCSSSVYNCSLATDGATWCNPAAVNYYIGCSGTTGSSYACAKP